MTELTPRRTSSFRFYAYWILALGAAVAAFCSYVHVRHRVFSLGYDLARERTIRSRLENERRNLEVETAVFEAPSDLAQIARDQLGLDIPTDGQVLDVQRLPQSHAFASAPTLVAPTAPPPAAPTTEPATRPIALPPPEEPVGPAARERQGSTIVQATPSPVDLENPANSAQDGVSGNRASPWLDLLS